MRIDFAETSALIRQQDNILILCHENPDGDCLGCAYALCHALHKLGKKARVLCDDVIPHIYSFIPDGVEQQEFEPEYIIAADVADEKLLGSDEFIARYSGKIDLCIDHHASNTGYAKYTLLEGEGEAAAAAETVLLLLREMNIEIDNDIAECIYVGLSTDTGCFRYSNTTSRTLRMAADMMDVGIRCDRINKIMFETRTKSYNRLETMALSSMKMHFDGKCAIIPITYEMFRECGSDESESHPIKAIPRQIEGVLVGATIKETKPGTYKISVRTNAPAKASTICAQLDGGGHIRAAGCMLKNIGYDEMYERLLSAIKAELDSI